MEHKPRWFKLIHFILQPEQAMDVCSVSHAGSADRQGLDMLQHWKYFQSYAFVLIISTFIIFQSYCALHLTILIS